MGFFPLDLGIFVCPERIIRTTNSKKIVFQQGSPSTADVKSDDKQENEEQSPRTQDEENAQPSPLQEKV